jgi:hypothetical protein
MIVVEPGRNPITGTASPHQTRTRRPGAMTTAGRSRGRSRPPSGAPRSPRPRRPARAPRGGAGAGIVTKAQSRTPGSAWPVELHGDRCAWPPPRRSGGPSSSGTAALLGTDVGPMQDSGSRARPHAGLQRARTSVQGPTSGGGPRPRAFRHREARGPALMWRASAHVDLAPARSTMEREERPRVPHAPRPRRRSSAGGA